MRCGGVANKAGGRRQWLRKRPHKGPADANAGDPVAWELRGVVKPGLHAGDAMRWGDGSSRCKTGWRCGAQARGSRMLPSP